MSSRSLGTLTVDLVAKFGGFSSGMDKAARESERAVKRITSAWGGVRGAIAGALGAIGAQQLLAGIIRNTTESEDAIRQLETRLASTGGVAGFTAGQLTDFAKELSGLTTYGTAAVVQMQALLVSFTNIRGERLTGATRAVLDLATALGVDLNSAASLVGKALNDPARGMSALGRAGVQFSEEQRRIIKQMYETGDVAGAQGIILDELQRKFGGAAQAAAGTFGGALAQLRNAFGDLLEADSPGLATATSAVQELGDLLRDPNTIQAAQSLTAAIATGFKGATSAIVGTVNMVRFLGEELAAAIHGPALDDIVRMEEELAEFQAILNSNPLTDSNWVNRAQLFSDQGMIGWWSTDELNAKVKELQGKIAEAYKGVNGGKSSLPIPGAGGTGGTGGAGVGGGTGTTEAFEKRSEALRRQIALFGESSEAARIAYDIQSGALEELTGAEQQRLLGMARQLDALREAESAAKSHAEALRDEARAMREFEESIHKSALAAAESFAPSMEGVTQGAEKFGDALERGAAITESVATPQERHNARVAELNDLLAQGAILEEAYGRAMAGASKELQEATNTWTVFKDQAARNTQDIIADTLRNSFDEGARGIIQSFGDMLRDLAAQAIAANIAGKIFGASAGGTGSGWIGAIAGMFTGGGAKAAGGPISAGMPYLVGERGPEVVVPRASGTVVPNHRLGSLGGMTVNQRFTVMSERGERVSRRTEQQVAAAAARGLAMASRRSG